MIAGEEASGSVVRVGIISAYPDEDWHAGQIAQAARQRASAEVLSPLDFAALILPASRGRRSSLIEITIRGEPRAVYDAFLLPRAIGDQGDAELQIELYRTLAEDGAIQINDVRALTLAIDKFKTSWILGRHGLPTPRAAVVQRAEQIGAALEAVGAVAVAKPLYGSLGIGVELVRDCAAAADQLKRSGALYLQEYVTTGTARQRDLRAFVVGQRVEAAIARTAARGDFRTNVHQGASVEKVQLDAATAALAVRATEVLGLDYAGVDLIESADGALVLEVNGTPLFRGLYQATGRNMADPIVEHALEKLRQQGK